MLTTPRLTKGTRHTNRRLADGTALAAELQTELERLGLGHLTAGYVPEKNVVRITWPHGHSDAHAEGMEVVASRAWVERMQSVLRTMARRRVAG